jgi:hypothetical protein
MNLSQPRCARTAFGCPATAFALAAETSPHVAQDDPVAPSADARDEGPKARSAPKEPGQQRRLTAVQQTPDCAPIGRLPVRWPPTSLSH